MNLNFTGVEEAQGGKYFTPGVYDVKISSTVFDTYNDKDYVEVFFENKEGAQLKERFYLTEKALPRVQHLAKVFTGNPIPGAITDAQLNAMLVGKKARIIVDGEIVINKDGKKVTYTRLRYSGFAEPLNGSSLTPDKVKIEDKTGDVGQAVALDFDDQDLPF